MCGRARGRGGLKAGCHGDVLKTENRSVRRFLLSYNARAGMKGVGEKSVFALHELLFSVHVSLGMCMCVW